jgi:predicted HNH restriction endonuclease
MAAQNFYIQYHNVDSLGTYPTTGLNFDSTIDSLSLNDSVRFDSWIYTRKKLIEKAVGQLCFLVVGKTEKIKKYYLWSFFKIEKCEANNDGFYNGLGTGLDFQKPFLLNDLDGFDDFKKFCGNFGIGFQNITNHLFCKTLISYASQINPLNMVEVLNSVSNDSDLKIDAALNDEMIYEIPSVQDYQDAIAKFFSPKQIEILRTLYYFPNASATAKDLAKALNYESYHAANRQIGKIGKLISQCTGIVPPTYPGKNGEQPAYFLLVGEYYKDTGWNMWEELQEALENLILVSDNTNDTIERLPTETLPFEDQELYKEGKVVQVFVNRYERNQNARIKCLAHFGNKCQVCDFDFGSVYGDIAAGFIHVHHKAQLAEIGEEYEVDPINDLIPVCANCHSVIHLTKPALTIEELKKLVKKLKR